MYHLIQMNHRGSSDKYGHKISQFITSIARGIRKWDSSPKALSDTPQAESKKLTFEISETHLKPLEPTTLPTNSNSY